MDQNQQDESVKETKTKPRKIRRVKSSTQANRPKPMKPLPTDRIAFSKQLDLLRAYAVASGPSGKLVSNEDVASIVKMTASTVSIANAFFSDTGLLQRGDGGYLPSSEVVSFSRAYEWSPETASHKLAPLLSESWFGKALMPKVSFRPLNEDEAISTLAEAATAGPDYRSQLRVLLDFLEAGGLIQREGNQVRQARVGPVQPRPAQAEASAPAPEVVVSSKSVVTTAFATQPTEGVVQFHVSVKVDMSEFAGWPADRIATFFSGIAQVLAAKGAIEKAAGSE